MTLIPRHFIPLISLPVATRILLGLISAGLAAAAPSAAGGAGDSRPQLVSTTGGGSGERTLAELEALAAKGEPAACFELGERLLEGDGVARNFVRARDLLQQAAEGGLANAWFRLGKMHYHGLGVKTDYPKAFEYYLQAAHRGVPEGAYNVGAMLASGRGVRRNFVEGLAWLILATKAGAEGDGEARLRERLNRRPGDIAAAEHRALELAATLAKGRADAVSSSDAKPPVKKIPAPIPRPGPAPRPSVEVSGTQPAPAAPFQLEVPVTPLPPVKISPSSP